MEKGQPSQWTVLRKLNIHMNNKEAGCLFYYVQKLTQMDQTPKHKK